MFPSERGRVVAATAGPRPPSIPGGFPPLPAGPGAVAGGLRPRWEELRDLVGAGHPGVTLVQRVCEVTVDLLGVSGAGMRLTGDRTRESSVYGTDSVVHALEDLQIVLGQGPGLQAIDTGAAVVVPDLWNHHAWSWPAFAAAARARGTRAVFAFPVHAGPVAVGALQVYRRTPGALDGQQTTDARWLADLTSQALIGPAGCDSEWDEEPAGSGDRVGVGVGGQGYRRSRATTDPSR